MGGGSSKTDSHFVSSGMSTYHNGNDLSGTHSFTNIDGNVEHETTGNLPDGFFPSMFGSFGLTTLILTIAVISTIVLVFISMRMKRRQSPPKGIGAGIGLDRKCDGGSYNDRIFPLSNKRPLAEALWNSDLLLEELVVHKNRQN